MVAVEFTISMALNGFQLELEMSDEATKLQAVGDFISKLTPKSLLLGVLAGFFALGLFNLYENRATAFLYIINSPSILLGLGGGLTLLACGWVVSIALKRLEEYMQAKIDEQARQIEELRRELAECREECRAGTNTMLTAILEKLNDK